MKGGLKNDRGVLIKKNMGPKIRALLIYECVCSMKPIKIDGVRVGGVGGYALIFTGAGERLFIVLEFFTGLLSSTENIQ